MRNTINYLDPNNNFYFENTDMQLEESDLAVQAVSRDADKQILEYRDEDGHLSFLAKITNINMEDKLLDYERFEYWL